MEGGWLEAGSPVPLILLTAQSPASSQCGEAGVLSSLGLCSHPMAGIALGSGCPGVHAEVGTHPAPNMQGMCSKGFGV